MKVLIPCHEIMLSLQDLLDGAHVLGRILDVERHDRVVIKLG